MIKVKRKEKKKEGKFQVVPNFKIREYKQTIKGNLMKFN